MSFSMLRFDKSTLESPSLQPTRFEITVKTFEDVRTFLAGETVGPVVFVCEESTFERFLLVANPKEGDPLIQDCGWQNYTDSSRQTTPLRQEFRVVRPPTGLRTRYSGANGVRRGVGPFLKWLVHQPGLGFCYFLSVRLEVWDELVVKAVDPRLVDSDESALRRAIRGGSPQAEQMRKKVREAGKSALRTLLLGESGTGKGLAAECMHLLSDRRNGPFVAINASVLEPKPAAALFGWVRGAFTDADSDYAGVFEEANGGTLFIDEIGSLPVEVQAQILKAIEDKIVFRMGSRTPIPVDVKLVCATNEDLRALMAAGKFRPELYARIAGRTVRLPPLRERREDIPELVESFWSGAVSRGHLSADVLEVLTQQDWPHNVRQLMHIVHQLQDAWKSGGVPTRDELLGQLDEYAATVGACVPAPASQGAASPRDTIKARVEAFDAERSRYERLEHVLRTVVERIVHESVNHASIYAHTATRAEIADRLHREGPDAELHPSSLCAVTVVVHWPNEKRDLYLRLKSLLELRGSTHPSPGEDLSSARLLPLVYTAYIDERSAHRLSRLGVPVPPEVRGLEATLEFRTVFEHQTLRVREAIGAAGEEIPPGIRRMLVDLEGFLRGAQWLLGPIQEELRRLTGSYGTYISDADARRGLDLDLQTLAIAPDMKIAKRAARLAIVLGDWACATEILVPYAHVKNARVLRDLGAARCKQHAPHTDGYQEGINNLKEACRLAPNDPDAFARLAGAYRRLGDTAQARAAYEKALAVDPGNPYALSGFIHTTLMLDPGSSVIAKSADAIAAAVGRCRDRVKVSRDMPWAFLDLGKFLLLSGQVREGLEAYAKAIGRTTAPWMLETTVRSLTELSKYPSVPEAFGMAVRLLVLGWCARFRSEEAAQRLASFGKMRCDLKGPVVMVVEAGDAPPSARSARVARLLAEGLAGFSGTVLTVGRDGWVVPLLDAATGTARHDTLCRLDYAASTDGETGLGIASTDETGVTLAPWADLVASRVPAGNVVTLFLGEGRGAAVDRELALAVGARIGVVPIDEDDDGDAEAGWEEEREKTVVRLRDPGAIAALVAGRAE